MVLSRFWTVSARTMSVSNSAGWTRTAHGPPVCPQGCALYQINKVDKLQKGVIVVAKITQNTDKIDNAIKAKGKHEEYRWISEEEAEKFAEPAINDFKDTLKKVFSMWDEIFKEK